MRRRRWPFWWLPWRQIALIAGAGLVLAGAIVVPPWFDVGFEVPMIVGFVLVLVVVALSYGRG